MQYVMARPVPFYMPSKVRCQETWQHKFLCGNLHHLCSISVCCIHGKTRDEGGEDKKSTCKSH